jgi:hypothetical protein
VKRESTRVQIERKVSEVSLDGRRRQRSTLEKRDCRRVIREQIGNGKERQVDK